MANWNEQKPGIGASFGAASGSVEIMDEGLRKHMLSIYNYMASGVMLSGIVALLFVQSPLFASAYSVVQTAGGTIAKPNMLGWIIMLAPLAFILFMSLGRNKFSAAALQMMFWGFATVMGASLSTVLITYTGESVALTFFATAGAFAGLSLWGYTTKKDISGWGSFLIMGMFGLIIASILNAFIGSGVMSLVISVVGLLIFSALTAYDTQKLKSEYIAVSQARLHNPAIAQAYPLQKMVIMGALELYLDFINMFLHLLRFMGSRD